MATLEEAMITSWSVLTVNLVGTCDFNRKPSHRTAGLVEVIPAFLHYAYPVHTTSSFRLITIPSIQLPVELLLASAA